MAEPADLPPGQVEHGGQRYYRDAKGGLVPFETVKAVDKLEDELVREVLGKAQAMSGVVTEFRGQILGQVDDFVELLDQQHQVQRGGKKGNVTLTTFDGTLRVIVQSADLIEFGASLDQAKQLVDACLREWSEDARPELRAIVQRAFDDKSGQVNRAELFGLLRLDIEDERWQRAMGAIRDSIRIMGLKRYVRFYRREKATDAWKPVSIDMAAA